MAENRTGLADNLLKNDSAEPIDPVFSNSELETKQKPLGVKQEQPGTKQGQPWMKQGQRHMWSNAKTFPSM